MRQSFLKCLDYFPIVCTIFYFVFSMFTINTAYQPFNFTSVLVFYFESLTLSMIVTQLNVHSQGLCVMVFYLNNHCFTLISVNINFNVSFLYLQNIHFSTTIIEVNWMQLCLFFGCIPLVVTYDFEFSSQFKRNHWCNLFLTFTVKLVWLFISFALMFSVIQIKIFTLNFI